MAKNHLLQKIKGSKIILKFMELIFLKYKKMIF
jgi:hypothetical protein